VNIWLWVQALDQVDSVAAAVAQVRYPLEVPRFPLQITTWLSALAVQLDHLQMVQHQVVMVIVHQLILMYLLVVVLAVVVVHLDKKIRVVTVHQAVVAVVLIQAQEQLAEQVRQALTAAQVVQVIVWAAVAVALLSPVQLAQAAAMVAMPLLYGVLQHLQVKTSQVLIGMQVVAAADQVKTLQPQVVMAAVAQEHLKPLVMLDQLILAVAQAAVLAMKIQEQATQGRQADLDL
jgi:hypothetical protein